MPFGLWLFDAETRLALLDFLFNHQQDEHYKNCGLSCLSPISAFMQTVGFAHHLSQHSPPSSFAFKIPNLFDFQLRLPCLPNRLPISASKTQPRSVRLTFFNFITSKMHENGVRFSVSASGDHHMCGWCARVSVFPSSSLESSSNRCRFVSTPSLLSSARRFPSSAPTPALRQLTETQWGQLRM